MLRGWWEELSCCKWWRWWLQEEMEGQGSCAKSALTPRKLVCSLCFLTRDTRTASRQERGQQLAMMLGGCWLVCCDWGSQTPTPAWEPLALLVGHVSSLSTVPIRHVWEGRICPHQPHVGGQDLSASSTCGWAGSVRKEVRVAAGHAEL